MIQSLSRGLELLLLLSERKSAGVTELAADLQVHKSTAFRLLETLEMHNFVEQDESTGKYMLGIGVLRISERLVNNFDIITLSKPYLYNLVGDTQESAHLCVLSSDKAFIVDQVISSEMMKVSAKIGMIESLYCSSVGKCLMAFRPERERKRILSRIDLVPVTPKTITSREVLDAQFEQIRAIGYAVDDEEVTLGVRCIAAPIYNHKGEVKNCLGISGPATRITVEAIEVYAKKVKTVADQISTRLGYKAV